MPKLLIRSEAAPRIGISEWRLNDLLRRGLIPERIMVGRYAVIPADQIETIRLRLIDQRYVEPQREAAHAAG